MAAVASDALAASVRKELKELPVPNSDFYRLANVPYEKTGAIAYMTVNRPTGLNALDLLTWKDLRTAFEDAQDDATLRVPLPDFVVRRHDRTSGSAGGVDFADDDQVIFSVAAELRRDDETVALVVRLVRAMPVESAALPEPGKQGLPKWRLKRALAHIEANLENPITLNDLAQAAGLSPGYFGAQFRLATGLSPHEYVLRERIRRAQELLLSPYASMFEVALSVGFQTQAHFSTVFKRIAGDTPSGWRRHRMNSAAA